jgi:hypothetical protein
MNIVLDRQRFDADPDPDPTSIFYADPDPVPTLNLVHVNTVIEKNQVQIIGMQQDFSNFLKLLC